MSGTQLIRIFQILAAILAGTALFLWWRDNTDWAFASGVCASASYFLSLRFQMKARVSEADAQIERERGAAAEPDQDEPEPAHDPNA